jgi:hypothetical protein
VFDESALLEDDDLVGITIDMFCRVGSATVRPRAASY